MMIDYMKLGRDISEYLNHTTMSPEDALRMINEEDKSTIPTNIFDENQLWDHITVEECSTCGTWYDGGYVQDGICDSCEQEYQDSIEED